MLPGQRRLSVYRRLERRALSSAKNEDTVGNLTTAMDFSDRILRDALEVAALLTAVENGGAGRSKMVSLGGVDLP
jgi:hypothetical protein